MMKEKIGPFLCPDLCLVSKDETNSITIFISRPNVEISMFPLFLPYGMFVKPNSTSNTFTKVFKYVMIMIAVPNNDK